MHATRYPQLPRQPLHDDGFVSGTTHQLFELVPNHSDVAWTQPAHRPLAAFNTRQRHRMSRMLRPSYETSPVVKKLYMEIQSFHADGLKTLSARPTPAQLQPVCDMWTNGVRGYLPAHKHESAGMHVYNSLTPLVPDPVFPRMSIFGKYTNPLCHVIDLCVSPTQKGDTDRMTLMLRNYLYFVSKQHWMSMNKRFMVYTGRNEEPFDASRPPYIFCMFPQLDYTKVDKAEWLDPNSSRLSKMINTSPTNLALETFDQLAVKYNFNVYFMIVLWRLWMWYPEQMRRLSWFNANYIASLGTGTLGTNYSSLTGAAHVRELPLDDSFVDLFREKLHQEFSQSLLKTTKTLKRSAKGAMKANTNKTNDHRFATYYTHHFIDPIHPLLDMSIYDPQTNARLHRATPSWCVPDRPDEDVVLIDPVHCMQSLQVGQSLFARDQRNFRHNERKHNNKRKKSIKDEIDDDECKDDEYEEPERAFKRPKSTGQKPGRKTGVIGSERIFALNPAMKHAEGLLGTEEAFHPANVKRNSIHVNHIVLQLLRFVRHSDCKHVANRFCITMSDEDFDYAYYTLGTDRLMYSVWIDKVQLWSMNPYMDLIGVQPANSTFTPSFIPPVWCLNNYSVPRFVYELHHSQTYYNITADHIKKRFAPVAAKDSSHLRTLAMNDGRKPRDILSSVDGSTRRLSVLLGKRRVEPLLQYEKQLLVFLYDFDFGKPFVSWTLSELWDIYQALTILTGSHSATLSHLWDFCKHQTWLTPEVIYRHRRELLVRLQAAELQFFQQVRERRSHEAYRYCYVLFDGTNNVAHVLDDTPTASAAERNLLERIVPYLFPLMYTHGSSEPVDPFVAFHRPSMHPPLDDLVNTMLVNIRRKSVREDLLAIESTSRDELTELQRAAVQFALAAINSIDTSTEPPMQHLKQHLTSLTTNWQYLSSMSPVPRSYSMQMKSEPRFSILDD